MMSQDTLQEDVTQSEAETEVSVDSRPSDVNASPELEGIAPSSPQVVVSLEAALLENQSQRNHQESQLFSYSQIPDSDIVNETDSQPDPEEWTTPNFKYQSSFTCMKSNPLNRIPHQSANEIVIDKLKEQLHVYELQGKEQQFRALAYRKVSNNLLSQREKHSYTYFKRD